MKEENVIIFIDEDTISKEELEQEDTYEQEDEGV